MKRRSTALIAAGLLLSESTWALPMVVQATRDTSVFYGTPTSDNSADGASEFLWLSTTGEGLVRRALVRFDLSALPPGTVVREARLSLFQSRSRTNHDVRLHRLTQSWGEGASNAGGSGTGAPAQANDATWVSRFHPGSPWQVAGGDFVQQASAVVLAGLPNERVVWGSTPGMVADVQGWLNQPATNHGWILVGDETNSTSAKRFESRQNGAAVNRPQLLLEVDLPVEPQTGDVPLPAWALVLAAAGLGWALHRRGSKGS